MAISETSAVKQRCDCNQACCFRSVMDRQPSLPLPPNQRSLPVYRPPSSCLSDAAFTTLERQTEHAAELFSGFFGRVSTPNTYRLHTCAACNWDYAWQTKKKKRRVILVQKKPLSVYPSSQLSACCFWETWLNGSSLPQEMCVLTICWERAAQS